MAHRLLPEALVGGVDREFVRLLGDAHAGMRQRIRTDLAVEGEAVDPVAGREHEHRTGPVQRKAGGALPVARLQKIGRLGSREVGRTLEHGEDRPDRAVDVEIERIVERVDGEQIGAAPVPLRDRFDIGARLREQPAEGAAEGALHLDDLVGSGGDRGTVQGAARNGHRDELAGGLDVVQEGGQLRIGGVVRLLLLDDEFAERSAPMRHDLSLEPGVRAGRARLYQKRKPVPVKDRFTIEARPTEFSH